MEHHFSFADSDRSSVVYVLVPPYLQDLLSILYLPLRQSVLDCASIRELEMRTLIGSQLIEEFGISYFKECSTLGAVSEKAIKYLLDEGKVLQLEKGDFLFEYGDRCDCFYVVLKGAIPFFKYHEGRSTYIRDYVFGEEIGFVAMIGLHDRTGSAKAGQDSIVLEVSSTLFYELHEIFPIDFGLLLLNLAREMSRVIRIISNKLVDYDIRN
ncbi:Crp/Fnr family transcriptional regulator [Amphritea sp. HPY]|uniref:Crp/Fnr family transcriptional regulator n=1 Tax=Amphritea sp. HPY TaxID=3421652 RepID=UPI003D7E38FC